MTESVPSESSDKDPRRADGQDAERQPPSKGDGVAQAPERSLDDDAATDQTATEPSGWRARLDEQLDRFDDFQQRNRFVSIPLAVWRKFSDDDGGKLASLISYYAFISIFPLLIVLATVLSRVLANDPAAADAFVQSAAGSFLSIGSDDSGSIKPLDVAGPRSRSQSSWPCGRASRSPTRSRTPRMWSTRCPRRSARACCHGSFAASRC